MPLSTKLLECALETALCMRWLLLCR